MERETKCECGGYDRGVRIHSSAHLLVYPSSTPTIYQCTPPISRKERKGLPNLQGQREQDQDLGARRRESGIIQKSKFLDSRPRESFMSFMLACVLVCLCLPHLSTPPHITSPRRKREPINGRRPRAPSRARDSQCHTAIGESLTVRCKPPKGTPDRPTEG